MATFIYQTPKLPNISNAMRLEFYYQCQNIKWLSEEKKNKNP